MYYMFYESLAKQGLQNKINMHYFQFSSVQALSRVQLFATPCSTPGLPVHHQLPGFTQTHVH